MSAFATSNGGDIVRALIAAVKEHRQQLTDIDGLIGDGDHGINMARGFAKAGERLGDGPEDFAPALRTLGLTLMNEVGGAMGPLYGSIFRSMAKAANGRQSIDGATFSDMLRSSATAVRELGQAELGDKTLLDALSPASDAFAAAVAEGKDFAEALAAMKDAALVGRDATTDMVAKKGRASRLGERSRGTPDAGATSCALILETLADAITPLLGG
jgi:dihydroxyacetone kinase phosphoprotein-dependent L subunit